MPTLAEETPTAERQPTQRDVPPADSTRKDLPEPPNKWAKLRNTVRQKIGLKQESTPAGEGAETGEPDDEFDSSMVDLLDTVGMYRSRIG